MDPPAVLFVPAQRHDINQTFEEGKYCAHEVCKHHGCRSKNLGCWIELKKPVNLDLFGY